MLVHDVLIDATVVQVFAGIAYANDGSNLDAVDLATGDVLQTIYLGGAAITGLALDGSTLYTMDASDRLTVIDISTQATGQVGSVVLPKGGGSLFVANGVAYVPTNDVYSGGYLTVDVSNPSAPALIQTSQNIGIESGAIALNGSGLGVAVGKDGGGPVGVVGVDVVNTSDPTNTGQFLTRYTSPGATTGPHHRTIRRRDRRGDCLCRCRHRWPPGGELHDDRYQRRRSNDHRPPGTGRQRAWDLLDLDDRGSHRHLPGFHYRPWPDSVMRRRCSTGKQS